MCYIVSSYILLYILEHIQKCYFDLSWSKELSFKIHDIWPKSKTLTTPNDSNRNSLIHCWKMQNSTITLEESSAVSCKAKPSLCNNPEIALLGYLLQNVENSCTQENLHINVYCSFVPNCQNLIVHMWRQGVHGKSLYFLLKSAMNLKLLKKTQSIKKVTHTTLIYLS